VALVLLGSASARTPLDVLDDAFQLDPYAVLRIPFLAERKRVRGAYVCLCRKEHPDLHGGDESMEWLMGKWAYRVLTDPQECAAYDTARVVRNALSLTEGIFAFGFAAALQLGAFVADAAQVMQMTMARARGSKPQLGGAPAAAGPATAAAAPAAAPAAPAVSPRAAHAAPSPTAQGPAGLAARVAPTAPPTHGEATEGERALEEVGVLMRTISELRRDISSLRADVRSLAREAAGTESDLQRLTHGHRELKQLSKAS